MSDRDLTEKAITLWDICRDFIGDKDLVGSWTRWHILVNRHQNYLGKVMLVLKRHETDVTRLTPEEQQEFWRILEEAKEALVRMFRPDHFNYAFLMNLNPHVHLHIIPRYAEPRDFAGLTFTDGRWGNHYELTQRIVPVEVRSRLAEALRQAGPRSTTEATRSGKNSI